MAEIKELKARDGYYRTQSAEVGENRIFVAALKGASIDEKDWREATVQEKEDYEKHYSSDSIEDM